MPTWQCVPGSVLVKKKKKAWTYFIFITCFTDVTLLFAIINNAIHFISSYSHILNIFSYFFIFF